MHKQDAQRTKRRKQREGNDQRNNRERKRTGDKIEILKGRKRETGREREAI